MRAYRPSVAAALPWLAQGRARAGLREIRFTVPGIAQPQGSSRALTYRHPTGRVVARVFSDNPKLAGWRVTVARAALAAIPSPRSVYLGAVVVEASFVLPRPRRAREYAITRPDVDKLARGVLDALTGLVWKDDAQVVDLHVTKQYAPVGGVPCALITIKPAGANV